MKTAQQLIHLLEPIRPHMEQVERLLCEKLTKVEEPLSSMLLRILSSGKRVRPALVILAGHMFIAPSVKGSAAAPSSTPFCNLAAAVEMMHTATLIHDDLIDEAPLRRGRRTLHTTWPARAAVLAGDYLLAQAASTIAALEHPRLLHIFSQSLCAMCEGEIRQTFTSAGRQNPREEYYRSIEAKTASLCAAAMEMAGVLAGAAERQIAALRRFGREFGMAFQITDDVLDFVGDEQRLGKPAGSDLRQGMVTLPTLYYLERAEDATPVRAVLAGRQDAKHVQAAIEAVRSSSGIEAALTEARAHVNQAQEALATLPATPSRQMLCSLAEYVVARGC
jgi:geranylgeranyl pyrophosphate synthase